MIHTFTRHSTTGGNSTLHPASSSSLSRPMDYQHPCRCSYTIGAKYTHYGRMQCSKRTTRGYGPYLSEFVDHLDTVIFFSSDKCLQACYRKWRTTFAQQFPPFTRTYWIVYCLSYLGPFLHRLSLHYSRPFRHFSDTFLYPALTLHYWIKRGQKSALYYRNASEKSSELWPRFGLGY
jgi:hypothetical protein